MGLKDGEEDESVGCKRQSPVGEARGQEIRKHKKITPEYTSIFSDKNII